MFFCGFGLIGSLVYNTLYALTLMFAHDVVQLWFLVDMVQLCFMVDVVQLWFHG